MTHNEIAAVMAEFSKVAAQLNQESDAVNSILASVERQLIDANVGIEVWLRALDSTDPEQLRGERVWVAQILGFAKIQNEWCLAVKPMRYATGFFEGDTSCPYQEEHSAGEPLRLLSASRDLRIKALRHLPELIAKLSEEAQAYIDTINDAKLMVR